MHYFYQDIFTVIDKSLFSVLFSDKKSRPNTPANQLVDAMILKHLYNWSFKELFTYLNFNILTWHALGVHCIDESIFREASIFNFQIKLTKHYQSTGVNLIEMVFCQLTRLQIQLFEVNTSTQRGDSLSVGSNIVDYSRLRLLVEVLKRLCRVTTRSR